MRALSERLQHAVARVARVDVYRCLILPSAPAQQDPVNLDVDIDVRLMSRSEIDACSRDPAYEISGRFLAGLEGRSDRCLGAFHGAKLVSYCFFAFEDTAIDPHLRFRYPRGWIYAYKAFTRPDWRGRGVLPTILREARGLGTQGLVTLALTRNHASLRAFAKAGFQPLRDIRVVVLRAKPRKILHFDPGAGFDIEFEPAR